MGRSRKSDSVLVVVTKKFNYRWPSRAVTELQPSPEPRREKLCVAEAAIAAGCAHRPDKSDADTATEKGGEVGGVAGRDSGEERPTVEPTDGNISDTGADDEAGASTS